MASELVTVISSDSFLERTGYITDAEPERQIRMLDEWDPHTSKAIRKQGVNWKIPDGTAR